MANTASDIGSQTGWLPTWLTPRLLCLGGVIAAAALIGTALYMQYVMYLDPCPLCLLQRWVVIAVGAVLLLTFVHYPRGALRKIYGAAVVVLAGFGVVVAGRHVWLQSLPPEQVPACGPGLEYLLETLPLVNAMQTVFKGSGECAEVSWRFLGLTIPGWTLLCFVGFALVGIAVIAWRRPRHV